MKTRTFIGGVFPQEKKELSNKNQIETVLPSTKMVVIPFTTGGHKNVPLVKVGDIVAKGQKIADSDISAGIFNAPVHASIAGTIKKIENRPVSGNMEAPCIVIQGDDKIGTAEEKTAYMQVLDPFSCSKDEVEQRIREAGIAGMGGAAFPTHVKFHKIEKLDYVLLNASECEPYITIDERTLEETPDRVIDGLSIAVHYTQAKGLIVITTNKEYLIPKLQEAISKSPCKDKISICLTDTKYPQGGEKVLIKAATGREVPSGGIPSNVGCMVINVNTACAISDAFRKGMPLIERPLTISGGACKTPKNIKVPVGTILKDLIPSVIEIDEENTCKILSGGPMMGRAVADTVFPIEKGTSGITFLTAKETNLEEESPCIGCGKCIEVCPLNLTPVMISRSLKEGNLKAAENYGLKDCMECGCCAFICPAHSPLVQKFRVGKAQLRAQMQKENK